MNRHSISTPDHESVVPAGSKASFQREASPVRRAGSDSQATLRGVRHLACAIMLLALAGAQGCSAATAAGCGVGTATGMLVATVAASSVNTGASYSAGVPMGTAMLGGAIFGVASGCAAAGVADLLARPKKPGVYVRVSPSEPAP